MVMNRGKEFLSILAGVAAGTVLGMVLAYRTKKAGNSRLSRKGEDLANALSERIDEKFDEFVRSAAGRVRKVPARNGSAATVE